MSRPRCALALALLALAVVPTFGRQASIQSPPTRDAIIAAARTVIGRARYASLVTIDATGQPQARIVDPFAPETDLTIWVATNAESGKVTQIKRNSKVTLLYFDTDARNELTLLGRASIVTGAAEKARYWKEDWAAFYSNKNLGSDYLLIRIVPDELQISAPSLGMNNDPTTWKAVSLKLR